MMWRGEVMEENRNDDDEYEEGLINLWNCESGIDFL